MLFVHTHVVACTHVHNICAFMHTYVFMHVHTTMYVNVSTHICSTSFMFCYVMVY